MKTLLLAQLAPLTKPLKDLTAKRLYALNFGAVVSIIKGREAADAVERLREYAAQVGKLRLGDGANPSVSVVLEGVDIGPILEQARGFDSDGARRAKVKQLLFAEMGLEIGSGPARLRAGLARHPPARDRRLREHPGDGPRAPRLPRRRRLPRASSTTPSTRRGAARATTFAGSTSSLDARPNGSCTVGWLPDFFSEKLQRELGQLVVLDRLIEGGVPRLHAPVHGGEPGEGEAGDRGARGAEEAVRKAGAARGLRAGVDGRGLRGSGAARRAPLRDPPARRRGPRPGSGRLQERPRRRGGPAPRGQVPAPPGL